MDSWCREELSAVHLGDHRLDERLVVTAQHLLKQPTAPINKACDDWADTKAAYRLFGNDNVTADRILAPHRSRTHERLAKLPLVLAVQDTSYMNYSHHPDTKGLGSIGGVGQHSVKGLAMHSTMAFTPQGLPLGLLDQKIWARPPQLPAEERGYKKQAIELKESYRWLQSLRAANQANVVTVCDREADIFEFLLEAQTIGANYLIRAGQDRMLAREGAEAEPCSLWDFMGLMPRMAEQTVAVAERPGTPARLATVGVHHAKVNIKPPANRKKSRGQGAFAPITTYAVWVMEIDPPAGVDPLEWMLLTNVPVITTADAIERINWYKIRWGIETYHKVLKSGFRVEDCRLSTAERLVRYLALTCVVAFRVFWLTYLNRHSPESPCTSALAQHEWQALYCKINKTTELPATEPTVRQAVRWIAQLGGFLARKSDGEPGVMTIWRGWQRLADIADTWLLLQPNPS